MDNRHDDLASRAKEEIAAMAKDGMRHPSTMPVLIGGGVGAVAAVLLPHISIPVGILAGAGFALWQRIKR
jgi:hypothetical protein